MVALEITEIGALLRQMLKGSMFDHFLLQEAVIHTACEYQIDGRLTEDYYSEEERADMGIADCRYIPFSLIRPFCLELMKGKRKPSFFRFVFVLSPRNQENTIRRSGSAFGAEDISGMFLNLTYKNGKLTCTTVISYHIFSMDKSLEQEWDRLAAVFFHQNGISAEPVR